MFEVVELGHFFLTLSLGVAILQVVLGVFGERRMNLLFITRSKRAAQIFFVLITASMLCLMGAFLNNNLSVTYVANNSNIYLPWYYKISASWAGHEGSLLLWLWVLSAWSFCVASKSHTLPPSFISKVLAILGVIAVGFTTFILFTSNPFMRSLPTNGERFPVIGKDLNPILQDIGLILHPPMLYMGYVGFAVSFAFIVAALIEGRLDTRWARWCRPWTMLAWSFLTIGIVMGSWWAYSELGWGGWWFWDPVENSSLMPWLAGTALIHSLAATEKRDVFKVWTAFLAITAFSLSLIGTFLVRSGVLTSVHAFASDPTRGMYILMLLGVISGSAYFLLIIRAHTLHSSGIFDWVSREVAILINNFIISASCLIVFVGTLAPLFYQVMGWSRISVGARFFNDKLLWLFILTLIFLLFAPYLRWKRDRLTRFISIIAVSTTIAALISYLTITWIIDGDFSWQAFTLISLIISALLSTMFDAYLHSYRINGIWKRPRLNYLAMLSAHLGFLVMSVGIIASSYYSYEKDLYVTQGDALKINDISLTAKIIERDKTQQYESTRIDFTISNNNNEVIGKISPEKRYYYISKMPVSESDTLSSLTRDIYVALGEPQPDDDNAWSVRVQIKPFIRWVWFGGLLMALASLFVISDKRYRIFNKN